MRALPPILPSLLLPVALGGALLLPAEAPAQVLAAEPQAAVPSGADDAWDAMNRALLGLDQAFLQQLDPVLWLDVRTTARAARDDVRTARAAGAPAELCLAVQVTLDALLARQEVLDPQFTGDDGSGGSLEQVAEDLLFVEGRIPQSTLVLVETLFELERDAEGEDALVRGLIQWPRDARFHDAARAWRDILPAPERIIELLDTRVRTLDSSDAQTSGLALETIGMLHATMGVAAYEAREFEAAGIHFDQAAAELHRSRSMPRSLSEDAVATQRADAAVNAAMSFLGAAQEVWFQDRSDRELAVQLMEAAEESIVTAMGLRPDHAPTLNAVLFIGETWKDKADVEKVTTDDLADSREFFGRMAERFDVADWWNNYAFWCRETALAAAEAGKNELAMELFEKSYQAYEKTIALEPDNARYVNDTGLILLYYLDRDLDRAEELFKRAWELGEEVCDNPFVDEAVAAENLSAYGDAMLNLALLELQRGDPAKAKEINDQLLELSPERFDARALAQRIEQAM